MVVWRRYIVRGTVDCLVIMLMLVVLFVSLVVWRHFIITASVGRVVGCVASYIVTGRVVCPVICVWCQCDVTDSVDRLIVYVALLYRN